MEKHEKQGLVRDHSDAHYEALTDEELKNRLKELGEFGDQPSDALFLREDLIESLKQWERTRHLMIWSDHSSIMNHGHILLTVNSIYDPAFYYTSQELGGKDVQELVEKPHVYLMARCRDTTEDQLLYSETRLEDVQQLHIKVTSSHKVPVNDICSLFHGEQIGGNYGCCGCSGASTQYTDHTASLRAPQITLEERRKKVLAGPAGQERRNGGVNPFQQLTQDELIRECGGRHLPTDGLLKPALYSNLREELKGVQRVPALCFPNQTVSLEDLNLGQYEVVPVEPLHDLKEYISNLLKELPKHLTDEEISLFKESVEAVLSTKENLRGSDYRLCCIILALHLGNNCRLTIRRLLYTLAELCELLYAPADRRTPRFILRLHNVTLCHVIAMRKLFNTPQVLTYRKLYGIYYHSITCHAPLTSRLISLSSVDTEEEEREFSTINSISKTTSNGHPEHIIPNCIVRAQAERNFKASKTSVFVDQQSKIGKFARNLPDFPNTTIPSELLDKELYQAHLEKISDFLLCGKGIWWHADEDTKEIVFHDNKAMPEFQEQGPPLHHFRSSSFVSERSYLENKWEECLAKPNFVLPIRKIKVYDSLGNFAYTEYYRVFQDELWPLNNTPIHQNQPEYTTPPLPDESADQEENDPAQPVAWTTELTATSEDDAEMSDEDDDDDDDDDDDEGAGDGSTGGDPVILGKVPESTHTHYSNNSISNNCAFHQPTQERNHLAITTNTTNQSQLQTKLATSVSKVLGVTPLVKTLDKAKKALHDKTNLHNSYYQNKYKDTLASVQTQVLAAYKNFAKEIDHWEREFVIKHGFAPNYEHYQLEPTMKAAQRKKKLSKDLLKHWKITVHIHS